MYNKKIKKKNNQTRGERISAIASTRVSPVFSKFVLPPDEGVINIIKNPNIKKIQTLIKI